jgi:Na+/H+-dicarboxylate symporter
MAAETSSYKIFGLNQWQQVLVGMMLGIISGILVKTQVAPENIPNIAEKFRTIGNVFFNLIKMVVVPLIFFALISGITSMQDPNTFKRIGIKAVSIYLLTSLLAVILGLAFGKIVEPGVGLDIDIESLASSVPDSAKSSSEMNIGEFLMHLIPTNFFKAMSEDQYLQIVVFSIFMGLVMNAIGDNAKGARDVINSFAKVFFKMIEFIVRLAPLAIFGFMAWMVAMQGVDVIEKLLVLFSTVVAACFCQYFVFILLIIFLGRISPLPFCKKMVATQIMAFSTSSSKATLSTAMRELQEKCGVSEKSTNFVLPLGACINMDGTAIYLGICAMFFAQVFGVELSWSSYPILILTCTLGSVGAAGIPSGSIIFMGMVLHSVGVPIEGIGIILGIDRLLDMLRTTVNITGDCAVTLIVDKSENLLDENVYYSKQIQK